VGRRQHTCQDLEHSVDDIRFKKCHSDLGACSCRYGQTTQQRCEGGRGYEWRATRREKEKVDSSDEFSVDQSLEVFDGGAMVGIDDADYTQASKFNKALIRITEAVTNYGPHALDHREVIGGDVSTAIRCGLNGSALNGDGEKVEVAQ